LTKSDSLNGLNREAVMQQSPGLARCATTLGLIGSKRTQPRWGCGMFFRGVYPTQPPGDNVGLYSRTASRL